MYVCHKLYVSRWLGFALMNVGETGNFISYGFAPASVVAPLGTVSVNLRGSYTIDSRLISSRSLLTVCSPRLC